MAYVNVDLCDIDTEDLVEELSRRGDSDVFGDFDDNKKLLEEIYEKIRNNQEYFEELRTYIYNVLGRIL